MPAALLQSGVDGRSSSPKASTSRPDVKEQNGLEVPRALQWVKWQAGGEFARVLVVKNVSTEVVRFTYKLLPHGSAFSVEFPEPRRLSPGMSATIKVLFRPTARQQYAEQLELVAGSTSIHVPLCATLPASRLLLPPAVEFGCVPVRRACVQQLPIKNVGDAPLLFSWRLEAPFALTPATGRLVSGQVLACELHFQPQEAAAYRATAACSLDSGELLTVQVSGMAKFPFLSLEQDSVDLGQVLVGHTREACVRFGNHSPVPASFRVEAVAGCHDGALSVQPRQGTLLPNEYSLLRVAFTPRSTGAFSCQHFRLAAEGGNSLSLACQGTAVGPALRLSARVLAFGAVRAGQAPSRALYLQNASDVPLHYEFLAEARGGVFELSRPRGVIPPRSMTHTTVGFAGQQVGTYWQRLVCLVKDSEPQAIDVLASCFDDSIRPPPLSYRHIAAYLEGPPALALAVLGGQRQRHAATTATNATPCGSIGAPGQQQQQHQWAIGVPDPAAYTLPSLGDEFGTGTLLAMHQQQQEQEQLLQLAGPDSWHLLFEGLQGPAGPAVTVTDSVLDFGCCSKLSPAEPRSFQVTNNTATKLLVSLLIPTWQDPVVPASSSKAAQQVFTAFPECLELRPHATNTMRVAFRPPKDGQYYSQALLLVASAKAMRSFRLVQDDKVVPPWSTAILACGNTFAAVNQELGPKVSLSSSAISFPPCRLGEAVHQTVCLTNSGDTPVHYAFTAPGSSVDAAAAGAAGRHGAGGFVVAGVAHFGCFAVLPAQGVLQPKTQHLVALRFQPTSLAPCRLQLACALNHNQMHSSASLALSGAACEPRLAWDVVDGRLFFRPTCVGAASQRLVTVRNMSSVPVGWQWVLSRKLQDAVSVQPLCGVLRGFEATKVAVSFAPARQGMHNARAALLLLPPDAVSCPPARSAAAAAGPAAATGGEVESDAVGQSLARVTPPAVASGKVALAEAAAALDGPQPEQQQQQQQQQQQDKPATTAMAASTCSSGGEAAAAAAASSAAQHSVEKLIVTIVGEATQGVLRVEPASLAFGSIGVGYPQSRTLTLVNQSTGVMRYRVCLVDERPAGAPDAADTPCEFSPGTSAVLASGQGAAAAADGWQQAASGGAGPTRCGVRDCWADVPEGTINPRATKALQLTILPRRRGQYQLRLDLHAAPLPCPLTGASGHSRSLSAGSGSGKASPAGCLEAQHLHVHPQGSRATPQAAVPRSAGSPCTCRGSLGAVRHSKSASCSPLPAQQPAGDGSTSQHAGPTLGKQGSMLSRQAGPGEACSPDAIRAVRSALGTACASSTDGASGAAAAASGDSGSWEGSRCSSSGGAGGSLERPPLASAAVTADASFPSLLLTDVFCEGLPKQVAWQLLDVSQLNQELRRPVSAAEVRAQELAEAGTLSNDNAALLLPPFPLDMGAAPAGGGSRAFWVTFANDGVLPMHWELHSYDAPQVDLENWVEPARPLTQAERERAFIIDNKVFEVAPHSGRLQPGRTQQVCLRFNPVAEGSYCLPLFLRVKDGKQLQLQLSASAVAPCTQLALAPRGSHSCLLAATPIGELQPPLQQHVLRNGGPAPLQYRLDVGPLAQLARDSYGADVIKYAGGSPLSGEIPPGEVAVFNWLFQPLEARPYSVALPLTLGPPGSSPQPLLLQGRGYHPASQSQQQQQAAPTPAEAAQHWHNWLGFSPYAASAATANTGAEDEAAEGLSSSSSGGGQARSGLVHNSGSSSLAADAAGGGGGRCILSSPEVLDLGVCLPASSGRQVLTLSNGAGTAMAFVWRLGVFEQGRGIMSGRLAITPAAGVLQPGEARVCQVSFESGLQPQLFSGEIFCHATPACPEGAACDGPSDDGSSWGQQGLTLQQWRQLRCEGQGAQEDEEVFEQQPARQTLPVFGRRLRQRLPLHLSMTEAICSRFDTLRQQFQHTLSGRSDGGGDGGACGTTTTAAGTGPACSSAAGTCVAQQQLHQQQCEAAALVAREHTLMVTLQGAVLSKAHINAGSYLQPQQLQQARGLLPVAHLLPAVQQPVSLLPPPGSLGTSAAAARAAAAAAAAPGGSSGCAEQQEEDGPQGQGAAAAALSPGDPRVLSAAGAVLQDLLTDVWGDEDVVSAFNSLPPVDPEAPLACPTPMQEEAVLPQPDFVALAEFVLDSAVLGVLQEGEAVGAVGACDSDGTAAP